MKRFLLSILMVVIGLSAFSQSPSRFINLRPAYPLVIGEHSAGNVMLLSNGLCMDYLLADSLPIYEIGEIFEQTVHYSEEGHGFYVKADSLHSPNVVFSYEVSGHPQGSFSFNESTGLFLYYPTSDEYRSFVVTFTAMNGMESISEQVDFNVIPRVPSEVDAFSTQGVLPNASDYTLVAEAGTTKFLNNEERTAYSISISGKDVVFDDAVQNKVWGLNGRADIYELNIYAERLIVRSALSFPQTEITIFAKEVIFEDHNNVVASISTTPLSEETLADGQGKSGATAGNITLNIKTFKSNQGMRLILNGAKGQSVNRNGTPGNGGNGGTVYSTIEVSSYCDFARGTGGSKYDVDTNGSANAGPVIGYGNVGSNGRMVLSNRSYAYLHPYYIAAVMHYANDAFINNHTDEVLQICREYRTAIDEFLSVSDSDGKNEGIHEGVIDNLDELFGSRKDSHSDIDFLIEGENDTDESEITTFELQNILVEINKMLFKLEQGLDYFGNPVGWVPMLSFEVMLANYNNEIDRAIPTLYMYYWLNRVDRTLEDLVQASQFAASTTEEQIDANQELLNTLILEIPVLQDEAEEITRQIEILTKQIETLQQQLLAKAIKKVKKKNRWKKVFGVFTGIVSAVSNVLPFFGVPSDVTTAVTGTISAGASLAKIISSNNNSVASEILSTLETIGDNPLKDLDSSLYKKDKDKDGNTITVAYSTLESYNNVLNNQVKPLIKNIEGLSKVLSNTTVSNSEVQAEFNRLLASSSVYQSLIIQAEELNQKKNELVAHLNQVFSDMTTTVSDLSNDALALDAFRRDVFTGNSKRDLNAMIFLERMQQRAKDRLLLYDYYLRKAYEYRLLKPYEGEFNLVGMFERFESIAQAGDGVIDNSAYSSLSSVFRTTISEMTQKIISGYNSNYPEQSAPITIEITQDQLDRLNAEESITLNFQDMGIFASDEENVRIVGLEIEQLESHTEGTLGSSGYMDLNMTHSGLSTFMKDGHLYWFDHRTHNTTSPHTWGARYDALLNKTATIEPSVASTSLLRSIVNADDVMLFSRPSAWSDIALTKKVHTSGGADIVIDKLVIKLQYDFTRRPDNIRNIHITACNGLMPYIACSETDINGRSGGNGHLIRSYTKSSQNVTFTATDKYESFYFKNWTDRAGNVISTNTQLTVNRQKDQYYLANYEYRGAVLGVQDTIRVSNEGGSYVVNISNIGNIDEEMEWYASADTLSTWIHLEGMAEGVDDGTVSFTYEPNTTEGKRISYIEIMSPDTYEMLKKVYIVQTDEIVYNQVDVTDISTLANAIYIKPMTTCKGSKTVTTICLKNAQAATAYVFDLVLPEGITVATNDKGKYLDELSSRHDDHTRTINYKGNNTYSLSALSGNSQELTGNDGAIRIVTLQVDDDMTENVYAVEIKNASYSKSDGSLVSLPDTRSSISVVNYLIGDVNGNGNVDIGDAVSIVNFLVGKESSTFVENAADTNNNGQIDIGDAVTIVNYLVGKTVSLSRQVYIEWNRREPQ